MLAILTVAPGQGFQPILGIACDARDYPGLQEALGPFSKYLPLRSHLSEKLTFSNLLQRTSEAAREAVELQDYFDWSQIEEFSARNFAHSIEGAAAPFIAELFEYQDEPTTIALPI